MFKKLVLATSLLVTQVVFAADSNANNDKIVAKVDGKPIYASAVKEKVTKFLEFNGMGGKGSNFSYDNLNDDMKREIIKNVILSDLVLKEAQKANINQDSEYNQALQFTENQLMQKIFLEKIVKQSVTEDKIQAEYKKYVDSQANVEEYKVAHILVKTEEEAKDIKKKLDGGADFAALAKEYSLDSNKETGGELDFFSKGQMVAPFEEAVEKLKIGQISGPVKTDFGYHIIKLIDKRKVKVMPLDEMREKIEDELGGKFIQEYITKLEKDNKVEFN